MTRRRTAGRTSTCVPRASSPCATPRPSRPGTTSTILAPSTRSWPDGRASVRGKGGGADQDRLEQPAGPLDNDVEGVAGHAIGRGPAEIDGVDRERHIRHARHGTDTHWEIA